MSSIRRVLVAFDFDGVSDAALRVASELAAQSDRRLGVLHVIASVADDASSRVHAVRARVLEALGTRHAEVYVRGGQSAAQIVALVEELTPDRVVMGTHQRGGLGRAWHGSVVDDVLRAATVPVMAVPSTVDDDVLAAGVVLCAVDFGPGTAAAIELARDHARDLGASLRLVHVAEPGAHDARELDDARESVSRRLGDLASEVRASAWTLLHGSPTEHILGLVRAEPPSSLVISGRDPRRGGWGARDVASQLVATAPVPVLVAPAHGYLGWRRASSAPPPDVAARPLRRSPG